jgi:hypothetical protein
MFFCDIYYDNYKSNVGKGKDKRAKIKEQRAKMKEQR